MDYLRHKCLGHLIFVGDLTDFVFLHQVSKKYVSKELAKEIHAKAAPFVKWLKEAEEESEGSEEEEVEEDENVEVTHFINFVFQSLCSSEVAAELFLSHIKSKWSDVENTETNVRSCSSLHTEVLLIHDSSQHSLFIICFMSNI